MANPRPLLLLLLPALALSAAREVAPEAATSPALRRNFGNASVQIHPGTAASGVFVDFSDVSLPSHVHRKAPTPDGKRRYLEMEIEIEPDSNPYTQGWIYAQNGVEWTFEEGRSYCLLAWRDGAGNIAVGLLDTESGDEEPDVVQLQVAYTATGSPSSSLPWTFAARAIEVDPDDPDLQLLLIEYAQVGMLTLDRLLID